MFGIDFKTVEQKCPSEDAGFLRSPPEGLVRSRRSPLASLQSGGVSDALRFLPPGSGPKRRSSLRRRRAAAAAAAAVAATPAHANNTTAQQSAIAATLSSEGVGASTGEGELSVARSMSPLLSELLNGKLGKTITMFCRRAAEESRASRRRGCVYLSSETF